MTTAAKEALRIPENIHGNLRRRIAAISLATAVGLGALGYYISREGSTPDNTSLSPNGKIELLNLGTSKEPFNILMAVDATILEIDKSGENLLVGVAVPGNTIEKRTETQYVDGGEYGVAVQVYSGAMAWFEVDKDTTISSDSFVPNVTGKGSDEFLKHFKVGDTVLGISAYLTKDENVEDPVEKINENNQALQQLESSLGQKADTGDKKIIFNANNVAFISQSTQ